MPDWAISIYFLTAALLTLGEFWLRWRHPAAVAAERGGRRYYGLQRWTWFRLVVAAVMVLSMAALGIVEGRLSQREWLLLAIGLVLGVGTLLYEFTDP